MKAIRKFLTRMTAVAAAAACSISIANATPFLVEYTVTDLGGSYRYDFKVTLDNNDASWAAGQVFDWFSFGNQDPETGSGGAFGDPVFLSSPAFFRETSSSGGLNGPTLCDSTAGPSCAFDDGGYVPTALNEMFTFSIAASTFLGAGELFWSNLSASAGNTATREIAVFNGLVSDVPLPAGALLFLTGFGGVIAARSRKKIAA